MALEKLSIKPRITIFSKTQNKISAILPQISLHLKRSKGGVYPHLRPHIHRNGQRIGSQRAGLATYGHIHRNGQEIDHLRPHTPQRAARRLATGRTGYLRPHIRTTGRRLTTYDHIYRKFTLQSVQSFFGAK